MRPWRIAERDSAVGGRCGRCGRQKAGFVWDLPGKIGDRIGKMLWFFLVFIVILICTWDVSRKEAGID